MSVNWSWERAVESIPVLLEGFRITLLATVAGFLIAAVLGLLVAVVRRSAPGIVTVPLRMVTEFIRLTPLVVQLLFAYLVEIRRINLRVGKIAGNQVAKRLHSHVENGAFFLQKMFQQVGVLLLWWDGTGER